MPLDTLKPLEKLRDRIWFGRKQRRHLHARTEQLLRDNVTPHVPQKTKQWIEKLGWDIMEHPSHSPDLAPSDFHLFMPLKHHLGEMQFETDGEVTNEVDTFYRKQSVQFFRNGIFKFVQWQDKCINCYGDYIEKQRIESNIFINFLCFE